ncbi:MAG: NAD-binding protein [Deltaproteobacteria bacterium]|nr:NAD-binding protein [Deltaproteobacteria bacterium]
MYIILGIGTAGYFAAKRLKEAGRKITLVDIKPERTDGLREMGFDNVVEGDITSRELLKKLFIEQAKGVIVLTTDLELNLRVARIVREISEEVPLILRAGKQDASEDFKGLEIDDVIYPSFAVAEKAIESLEKLEAKKDLKRLGLIISQATKGIAIVTQDNPDPDAIASAMTLKMIVEKMGKSADIIYGGEIGYDENKALINLLGIEAVPIAKIKNIQDYSKIALIEASIPGENNSLPKEIRPHIIIDHHPFDATKVSADYIDIRPELGATSTIFTEYLTKLDYEISEELATLLLYGIKTDTGGFTRGATSKDLQAVALLYPKASQELLNKIETPLMSSETLDVLGEAIKNRRSIGSLLLANVGFIKERDTLPQAADHLLKLEGVSIVLVYGLSKEVVHISARNKDIRINLGDALKQAFGDIGEAGGHPTAAAAKINLGLFGSSKDKESLLKLAEEAITDRFLKVVGIEEKTYK